MFHVSVSSMCTDLASYTYNWITGPKTKLKRRGINDDQEQLIRIYKSMIRHSMLTADQSHLIEQQQNQAWTPAPDA